MSEKNHPMLKFPVQLSVVNKGCCIDYAMSWDASNKIYGTK